MVRLRDDDFEVSRAEWQLILEVASYNEFEGVLRDLFPSLCSAGFCLVAWLRQANFADRFGAAPLPKRAVEI